MRPDRIADMRQAGIEPTPADFVGDQPPMSNDEPSFAPNADGVQADTVQRDQLPKGLLARIRYRLLGHGSSAALDREAPFSLFGGTLLKRVANGILLGLNGVGFYLLVGMIVLQNIDNNPDFKPASPIEGGLRSIDIAAALIEREVDTHEWVVNSPFFSPGYLLDNMASYQEGVIYGLGRFTTEMVDHIGRTRGSSQVDPDLDRANGLLRFPGDVWIFEPEKSFAPMVTSEEQYRAARQSLLSYNRRFAEGRAVFDPRIDNFLIILERIAADVGSQSALLENYQRNGSRNPLDTRIDRLFFETKGRLYAYYLILKALEEDFANVIEQRDLGAVWRQMLGGFREAAGHVPFMVLNSEPGSLIFPSHLAEQGFFILRAKTQLLDVVAVLRAS